MSGTREALQSVAAGPNNVAISGGNASVGSQCRLSLNIFVSAYIFVKLTISWYFTRWARRKEREPVYISHIRAPNRSPLWMKSDQSHAIRKFMRESPFLSFPKRCWCHCASIAPTCWGVSPSLYIAPRGWRACIALNESFILKIATRANVCFK